MSAARYFIRREDDEPPRTPAESPFRRFDAKCLKCGSYGFRLAGAFDEPAGEVRLVVSCSAVGRPSLLNCVETSAARNCAGALHPQSFGETAANQPFVIAGETV